MSALKLEEVIASSNNIVFFGGAGVSTESNIPDFRSASGLYKEGTNGKYSPEQILSNSFFNKHMQEFYDFYKSKMIYSQAKPNPAHYALAKLEEAGKLRAVITQNIDGLHQAAGSKNVLELHGSVHRNYCINCGKFYDLDYIMCSQGIPKCYLCNSVVKPDVVLYEESLNLYAIEKAVDYISKADVFIIGGTSLSVQPSAGLISNYKGNKLVLINLSKTFYDNRADIVLYGKIGEILGGIKNSEGCRYI